MAKMVKGQISSFTTKRCWLTPADAFCKTSPTMKASGGEDHEAKANVKGTEAGTGDMSAEEVPQGV